MAEHNIPITIYLSRELKDALDACVRARGFTVTGFARVAIQERLDRLATAYDAPPAAREAAEA